MGGNCGYSKVVTFIPLKNDSVIVLDYHPAIVCVLKQLIKIADIEWTPLHPIPSLTNEWLPSGSLFIWHSLFFGSNL